MTYQVRTAVFEGPLDLLLHLINRHQLDVTSLNLTDLVGEYLVFLDEMRALDLDVTSEFLLIAATLIHLKARSLLPQTDEVDLDEELLLREERDRLLARLLQCVTFKDVAAVLRFRLEEHQRMVPRISGIDQEIRVRPQFVALDVDPLGLARIAGRALSTHPPLIDLDHLDLGLPSVQEAVDELRRRVEDRAAATFDELIGEEVPRPQVIAYFLALLELARWGLVALSQGSGTAPILVEHKRSEEILSEWS